MSEANGNGNRNLPAKTPRVRLGAGRPSNAIRERARTLVPKGLKVIESIINGEETEPRVVDKEIVYTTPTNRDKIAAVDAAVRLAGYGSPKPVSIETSGDVRVLVIYDDQ